MLKAIATGTVMKVKAQESQDDEMSRRLFDSLFGCLLRTLKVQRAEDDRTGKSRRGRRSRGALLVIRHAIEEVIANFSNFEKHQNVGEAGWLASINVYICGDWNMEMGFLGTTSMSRLPPCVHRQ